MLYMKKLAGPNRGMQQDDGKLSTLNRWQHSELAPWFASMNYEVAANVAWSRGIYEGEDSHSTWKSQTVSSQRDIDEQVGGIPAISSRWASLSIW